MTKAKGAVRWSFEKIGLSYRLWAEDAGVELRLGRLKRSGQELQGELRISVNWDGIKTVDGQLHQARFNVSSVAARSSLIKHLKNRTDNTPFSDMDWGDALEHLCTYVLDHERQGEPLISMDGPVPERKSKYDVKPILPHGVVTILYAPGGVGKSVFATAVALSIAKGMEIIPGLAPQVKGPVLYIDYETDAYTVQERVNFIANGHDFKPTKDFYYRRSARPLADDAEELSRIVEEKGIKFAVVDSCGPAMGASTDRGDASDTTNRLFSALRLMNCTVLIVDHVSKDQMRNRKGEVVGSMPYGSVYKVNLARATWELQNGTSHHDDDIHLRLVNTKANDSRLWAPVLLDVVWDSSKEVILFVEADEFTPETYHVPAPEAAGHAKPSQRVAMIDALENQPNGLTAADLSILAKASKKRVNNIIREHRDTFDVVYGSDPPRYVLAKRGAT
jgi:hypothetical protein